MNTNEINDLSKDNFENMIDELYESKTFITSMYLLKYLYDRDEKALNMFSNLFSKLTYQEQVIVLNNVHSNLEPKKEKQKVKKKNG